jgi:alpha-beta hydrolase superfamily lysophospholipase
LSHPSNRHKAVSPSPARTLFQLALSAVEPHSPAEVNTKNETHGPLLLIAAKQDHTVDKVLVHSALKQYRKSSAITELTDYDDRGHSLVVDSGAHKLIDDSLAWLAKHDLH